MSEHFDPFEAELAALKPEQPSCHLQQRIADQLQDRSEATASSWFLFATQITAHRTARLTAAAGLAASALAAFVLSHRSQPNIADFPAEIPQLPVATAFDDALPTVWAYQRALSHSPSELEALLDKHASLASHAAPTPNHLLIRSDRNLLLPGEL
jgi:hypothetical protein